MAFISNFQISKPDHLKISQSKKKNLENWKVESLRSVVTPPRGINVENEPQLIHIPHVSSNYSSNRFGISLWFPIFKVVLDLVLQIRMIIGNFFIPDLMVIKD